MEKRMLLLPTFDGQTRGVAAVNVLAIDLIKPSVSPGKTTLLLTGDHNANAITIELEMHKLVERLKAVGVEFLDLADGRKMSSGFADNGE